MSFRRPFIMAAVAGLLTVTGVAAVADSAEAQSWSRQRSVSVSGPYHSATRNVDVYRSPASATVYRSGSINGQAWPNASAQITVVSGTGYATTAVHTGPVVPLLIPAPSAVYVYGYGYDNYSRSSSVQTSNGYGYDRQVYAYRDGDGVTVNRTATANNGASRSSSVTRTR